MNVRNNFSLIFLLHLSISLFGQKPPYPKDTIFVKYYNIEDPDKWNKKFHSKHNGKKGIYFNLEHPKGDMALFYDETQSPDTLCVKHLDDYHFSNLEEIDQKRYRWIFDNKRPPANRNGVFQTFLIEVISKEKFVIYPVVWRNEGY